jgi:hypothetical protein
MWPECFDDYGRKTIASCASEYFWYIIVVVYLLANAYPRLKQVFKYGDNVDETRYAGDVVTKEGLKRPRLPQQSFEPLPSNEVTSDVAHGELLSSNGILEPEPNHDQNAAHTTTCR